MELTIDHSEKATKWDNESDTKELIELINSNLNAKVIDLHGNTLGVQAAESIGKALEKCKRIKKCIFNDLFTGRMKTEIAPALKHLSVGLMAAQVKLVELNVSDNAFGPNGVVGITDLLSSPACYSLKYLKMHNLGLGHEGCRQLCEALKTGRQNSNNAGPNLKLFWGGRNRLENVGAKSLSSVLSPMGSLEEIAIYQNGIGIYGDEGSIHLANIIENNPNLRKIDFSDNSIRPEGMKNICRALCVAKNVDEIRMDDCIIKSEGLRHFRHLLEDLDNLPLLEKISLSGNEFHTKEAKKFILILGMRAENVNSLSLDNNDFGEEGLEEILDTLEEVGLLDKVEKTNLDEDEESSTDYRELIKKCAFDGNQDPDDDESNDYDSDNEEEEDEDDDDEEEDYDDEEEELSDIDEKEVTITQEDEILNSATCTPNKFDKSAGLFGCLGPSSLTSNTSFSFIPKEERDKNAFPNFSFTVNTTDSTTLFKPSLFSKISPNKTQSDDKLTTLIETNFKLDDEENYWSSSLPEESCIERLSKIMSKDSIYDDIKKLNISDIQKKYSTDSLVYSLMLILERNRFNAKVKSSCISLLAKLVDQDFSSRNAFMVHIGAIKPDSCDKRLCSVVGQKNQINLYLTILEDILKVGISGETKKIFICLLDKLKKDNANIEREKLDKLIESMTSSINALVIN